LRYWESCAILSYLHFVNISDVTVINKRETNVIIPAVLSNEKLTAVTVIKIKAIKKTYIFISLFRSNSAAPFISDPADCLYNLRVLNIILDFFP